MLDLVIAVALVQAANSCHAIPLPPGQAGCPAWRPVHSDGRDALFADPASLVRGGARFDIQLRFVYAEAAEGEIRSIVTGFRFDCAARTVAIGRGHAYDTAGAQLDEEEPAEEHTAPAPVVPGTPEAAVIAAYCPG